MVRTMTQALDSSNCGIGTARNRRTWNRMSGRVGDGRSILRLPDSPNSQFSLRKPNRARAVIIDVPESVRDSIDNVHLTCLWNREFRDHLIWHSRGENDPNAL